MFWFLGRSGYINSVVIRVRISFIVQGLLTSLLISLLNFKTIDARYNVNVKRAYKPKTDSVTYQDRAKKFRRGLAFSKVGDYLSIFGTGLLLTGVVLNDEKITLAGTATMGIGLPLIGFGSLYMKSSILSEATFKPNGFPWYLTSLVMAGALFYTSSNYNLTLPMLYGGGIIVSSFALTSWVKFSSFRNLMTKRYSEYAFTISPVIYLAKSGPGTIGVQSKIQF